MGKSWHNNSTKMRLFKRKLKISFTPTKELENREQKEGTWLQ